MPTYLQLKLFMRPLCAIWWGHLVFVIVPADQLEDTQVTFVRKIVEKKCVTFCHTGCIFKKKCGGEFFCYTYNSENIFVHSCHSRSAGGNILSQWLHLKKNNLSIDNPVAFCRDSRSLDCCKDMSLMNIVNGDEVLFPIENLHLA